jgi:hypothetical protein
MKFKQQVIFPCGYDYTIEFQAFTYLGKINSDLSMVCPMHKEKCKSSTIKY